MIQPESVRIILPAVCRALPRPCILATLCFDTTRLSLAALLLLAFGATTGLALAQRPGAVELARHPRLQPTPSAPSDPCGSILSIVNRPTVTTGVCTVRTGHFDVETGYTNTTTTGTGGGSSVIYPQPLIRIGTANPHFDLEFGPPSYATTSVGTPARNRLDRREPRRKARARLQLECRLGRQRTDHFSDRKLGILRRKHAVHRKLQRRVYGKLGASGWPDRSASTPSPA